MSPTRRTLLTGVSAAALAAALGACPAEAQGIWRFLRRGPARNKDDGGGSGSPPPRCPPHLWVLWGQDKVTGRHIMKCMKCGLIKIG